MTKDLRLGFTTLLYLTNHELEYANLLMQTIGMDELYA